MDPVWELPAGRPARGGASLLTRREPLGRGRVLIIPVRPAAALYSLHSCHLRSSLINNKNSRRSGARAGRQARCRARYEPGPQGRSSPQDPHFPELEAELSPTPRLARGHPVGQRLPDRGAGRGEAGRGAAPSSPGRRGAGREARRAGASADGHLKWPPGAQGRCPGKGRRSSPGGGGLRAAAGIPGGNFLLDGPGAPTGFGLLNPRKAWPAGVGGGAEELGREGEGLCRAGRGCVRGSRTSHFVWGCVGERIFPQALPGNGPHGVGGSDLRGGCISRELGALPAWVEGMGWGVVLDPSQVWGTRCSQAVRGPRGRAMEWNQTIMGFRGHIIGRTEKR